MSMKRLAAIAVTTIVCATTAGAAETLAQWAANEKLPNKMVIYGHGMGAVGKLQESGIARPKRVGLVSFYLWDSGSYEFNAMARAYGGTYERTAGLTPKGANHFATRLAESGVPALKKAFAAHGMELLEPVEFVTSDAMRQTYVGFDLPMGGLGKATMNMAQWIERTPKASSAAAGYTGMHAHLWQDAKMLTALEELRVAMGLDAIAILANSSTSDKDGVWLTGVDLLMYGANPVPKPPQKIAQYAWSPGALYGKGNFGKGFKGAPIATMNKGHVTSESYDGYDRIVETLARQVLARFDELYAR